MNVHGRTASEDCCHTNNRLEGYPCADLYDLTLNKRAMGALSYGGDEGETMVEKEIVSGATAQLWAGANSIHVGSRYDATVGPSAVAMLLIQQTPHISTICNGIYANPMETPEFCMQVIEPIAQKSEKTPSFIVNTHTNKNLIDSCCKNCTYMSDANNYQHTKVIEGLSKPYNSTLINVLKYLLDTTGNSGRS